MNPFTVSIPTESRFKLLLLGLLKLIFNIDNGKVLGAHIFGLHAADLIQEISNAISRNQDVIELSKEVHTHPTLSEVVEVAYKQAASQIK